MNNLIKKAFTLIELLVVIAIIGILSGLIVVAMGGITNSANIAKSQVFANSLRNALMLNLVSEWKLDENTGISTADSWSGGNTGTLTGPTTLPIWATGKSCTSGSCVQFDGTDDYVDVGNNANLNPLNEITIGLWFKPTATGTSEDCHGTALAGHHNSAGCTIDRYGIGYSQNKKFFANIYNGTTSVDLGKSSTLISPNVWAYGVWTFSSNTDTSKIYLNGVLEDTKTSTWNLPSSASSFKIGKAEDTQLFTGLIDEVRVYNAVVPISEIKEQYYAGLNSLFADGSLTAEEYAKRISEASVAEN